MEIPTTLILLGVGLLALASATVILVVFVESEAANLREACLPAASALVFVASLVVLLAVLTGTWHPNDTFKLYR
jgi:hypothetical protein